MGWKHAETRDRAELQRRNEQIIALRQSGIGPRKIARWLSISPSIVNGVLHRAGMTSQPVGRGFGHQPETKAAAVALSMEVGPSAAARTCGVSETTIFAWRKELAA